MCIAVVVFLWFAVSSAGKMLICFQLMERWQSLDDSSRRKYTKKAQCCPEPCLSIFRPDICFGSVSETFHDVVEEYLDECGAQTGTATHIENTDIDR